MDLVTFRLNGPTPRVDPEEARRLAAAAEEGFARAPWAEHSRVYATRRGVLGVVFCRSSQAERVPAGLRAVASAAVQCAAKPADWRLEP